MPRVLNKRSHGVPLGSVYVGRPSKWGNPFSIGKDGNRDEVIRKYKSWLHGTAEGKKLLDNLSELRGKNLVCWCAPLPCHADILLKLANKVD